LLLGVLRERSFELFFNEGLEFLDNAEPGIGIDIRVERQFVALLVVFEDLFEFVVIEAEDHIRIHLDEAPVAVIGEPAVASFLGNGLHGLIVQAEIENRIHHARHRNPGARAYRNKQGSFGVSERSAGCGSNLFQSFRHLRLEFIRIGLAVLVIPGADFRCNGEAGWNRQAEAAHFRKVGALSTKQIAHLSSTFCVTIAETVDPLGHLTFSSRGTGDAAPPAHCCAAHTCYGKGLSSSPFLAESRFVSTEQQQFPTQSKIKWI